MKNRVYFTFLMLIFSANAAFSIPLALKDAIVKFSLAMGGVIASSVLIFFGLSVYNKIREKNNNEYLHEEDALKTPKTTEDAIEFFIRKNRLK